MDAVLAYWRMGGPLMAALAVVTFGIWFFFLGMRQALLEVVREPGAFEQQLRRDLPAREPGAIVERYAARREPLPVIVARVLRAAGRREAPAAAFDEAQRHYLTAVGRNMIVLAALTAAAPLVGLLGTVIGMVTTFDAVSGGGGQTAAAVSDGISQALITTQFGLVAAIPGLFGMARIQRLFDQAKVRLQTVRTSLLLALDEGGVPA